VFGKKPSVLKKNEDLFSIFKLFFLNLINPTGHNSDRKASLNFLSSENVIDCCFNKGQFLIKCRVVSHV